MMILRAYIMLEKRKADSNLESINPHHVNRRYTSVLYIVVISPEFHLFHLLFLPPPSSWKYYYGDHYLK